jgi:Fur family zinc uptake transcriptional regulator
MATAAHRQGRHWAAGSQALADAARAHLEAEGVQWTELRAHVFEVLAREGRPMSAYLVAEQVSAAAARRIAANSVYRILDLFVAHNVARRVESRNAYIVNLHPDCSHDCIYLVCEGCGSIAHLDDDALAAALRARAGAVGFVAHRPVLELIGTCQTCVVASVGA